MRNEAVADKVGDVVLYCTGGSAPTGGVAATYNISVSLPTPITSRLIGSNNAGSLTEALLLIDDPSSDEQYPCTALSCPFVINGSLGNGSTENKNVYQGVLTNANTVTFLGVPVVEPGGQEGSRYFRIVNLRTAASSATGTTINATITSTNVAGGPLPVSPSTVLVANILSTATYAQSNSTGGATGVPPVYPAATPQNPTVGAATTPSFYISYTDGPGHFFSLFKKRNPGTSAANPGVLLPDAEPYYYGAYETGFYNPAFTATNGLNVAGLASAGTRFEARFSGIPAGVSIYAGTSHNPLLGFGNPNSPRLVGVGNSTIIAPTVTIAGGLGMAQLTVTAGAATAVWEVFDNVGQEGESGSFYFPIVVSYSGVPAAATVAVGTSLGPVDAGTAAASTTLPVPRFRAGAPFTAFTITAPPTPPPVVTTTSLPNGQQGRVYPSTTLTANGGLAPLSWSIFSGALPSGLTLSSAGVITGTPSVNGTFNFTVRVTDSNLQTGNANLSILVRPPVSISTTSLPNGSVGVSYSADVIGAGGSLPYNFVILSGALPPGLGMSTAGAITGLPSTAGTFNFTVQVTDGVGQTATAPLSIGINAALTITTSSLPSGQTGTAYTTTLAAAGGTPAYTWSLFAGALPGGLTLSSAGVISGNPSATGTFNFTARVTDATESSANRALSIVIGAPLTITTNTLPGGLTGTAYSTTLAATGGTPAYTWSVIAGALPGGLSLSTAGVISGNPNAAGTFSFTAEVLDSLNVKVAKVFSITIQVPLSITTSSLPPGVFGTPYSTTLVAAGGTPSYNWSLSSGALPGGLTLSSAGVISGTPNATGTFAFVARVFDGQENSVTRNLSIVINPSISILTSSLPEGQAGVAYTTTLTRTGGVAPFTWTVSAGALPTGLTLATTGVISGAPAAAGTANFTAQVTDSGGQIATASLQLTTRNRVTISSQILPDAEVNRAYNATLQASGGLPPFRWSLLSPTGPNFLAAKEGAPRTAGGELPPGLTLDPAGFISGTPTTQGSFAFTLVVTDSASQSASGDVQLLVGPSNSFTIPTFSIPSGAVECQFNNRLQASGGSPPYTWSAIGLPDGLSVSSSGQITGQPRSDGSFVATFIVTDANGQTLRQEVRFKVSPALTIISPESIDPFGTDQPIPIAFAASGGTPPYTFSLESGTLPQGLSIDSQGLIVGRTSVAGTFGVAVKVADSCGVTATRSYPVRILPTKLAECALAPQPETLKFTVQQGTGAVTRTIGLATRCAAPLSLNVQADSATGWLRATPGSIAATLQNGAPPITVTANPGSLPVGTYTGSVGIAGTLGASVPVVMSVVSSHVALQVSPVGVTFTAVQNGPAPAPKNINIVALPRGPLSWSASTSTTSGGQWFSISNGGGSTDAGQPGQSTLSVQASTFGLAPGEYYGTIEIEAQGAANASKTVTVVLNVLPADQSNVPTPDQSGFILTGSASRTVVITNPSSKQLTFSTSRHQIEGRIWFTVDPASGTLAPGGRLSMRITPDAASLGEPGVRRSLLTVRFSDGNFINIEVVQVVPLISSANPASADEPSKDSSGGGGGIRALAGCKPTKLVGVFTTLQQNFSVPVGWPTGIDMEVVDDCAEPLGTGYGTVGFSCCDSPKAMIPLQQGRLSATWVARAPANTEVAVTSDYANESKSLQGTHSVSGVIARTGNPPIIAPGGAVSGATFGLGQPLAPGILTSVFGQRMADATVQSQSLPLSTTLGATSASLGGKLLPLFFASDGQVNTLAPFDLPTNTELSLIVRRGASLSAPETVTIASSAPGMFTRNQAGTGQAAVVDVQGRVIEPGNAMAAGGVAILFATGLGAVDQVVQSGAPAPGIEPLARTVSPVEVKVGGVTAQVFYAGLAPGFVGLYQINFSIPNGVTPGDAVPLTITTAGATSSPGTIAIR